jgi:hypothetical protein
VCRRSLARARGRKNGATHTADDEIKARVVPHCIVLCRSFIHIKINIGSTLPTKNYIIVVLNILCRNRRESCMASPSQSVDARENRPAINKSEYGLHNTRTLVYLCGNPARASTECHLDPLLMFAQTAADTHFSPKIEIPAQIFRIRTGWKN